jgi:hypothetical protein
LEGFDSEAEDTLDSLLAELENFEEGRLLQPVRKVIFAYDMGSASEQQTKIITNLKDQNSE